CAVQCPRSLASEPHARGGGPPSSDHLGAALNRAPRTWGWSVVNRSRIQSRAPSPTHVGGGPRRHWLGVPSPTHVGVVRGLLPPMLRTSPEPHARGGGPEG